MSAFNNDATLDIAIEPQHHATLKEKAIGSAQILQGKMTGDADKRASGHMKKYGYLDHTFANAARMNQAKTPESRRDLIRQAEAGQKHYEDGWGDVEGTVAGNPNKDVFVNDPNTEGLERTGSDESATSTNTATTTSSHGLDRR